jgi:Family of unknown function (DUF6188)
VTQRYEVGTALTQRTKLPMSRSAVLCLLAFERRPLGAGQSVAVAIADDEPTELPLHGATVTQIRIDHRLGLLFDSGAELAIGGVASLRSSGGTVPIEPDRQVNVLATIDLLWDAVTHAQTSPTGRLTIEFAKGRTLGIDADVGYEAWEFVTADAEVRVVCLPGGGLATWGLDT